MSGGRHCTRSLASQNSSRQYWQESSPESTIAPHPLHPTGDYTSTFDALAISVVSIGCAKRKYHMRKFCRIRH
ncbi:hypothetical protein GCK32_003956 [Trichostrongylus colubriformis]|uniref:Uncharacterized protein n=1 Tax=Trichostrongylus colubriformis TaxID=6319 RepID=A0AAN8EYA9_TRICO